MTYLTSRNFDHLTTSPTSEYREKERKKAEEQFLAFRNKRENRSDYLSDVTLLREALDDYEKIQSGPRGNGFGSDFGVIGPESFYYRMKLQLHSGDQDAISKSKQADEFAWYLKNMVLFFPLSLTQIPETKQSEFLADPLLEPYHHFLEKKFRSSKHQLSPECEKIINLFEETSYKNWDSMTSKFLSTSQKEIMLPTGKKQVTLEELFSYTCNDDVSIRQQAIHAVDEIHLEAKEMAENETNAILSYKKTLDTLRGFSSAEDFIALRDDIDLKTIHTMIDAVRESYSFSRDFYQFKADLFGVKNFSYSERNLSYGSLTKQYPFDEAVKLCQQTLGKWDSELLSLFNQSLSDGKIDVFPQQGKRGGAFCTDSSKGMPVYVCLNYTNHLGDVFALIHESGHFACDTLQQKYLNGLQYGSVLACSETPSTFYELLLEDELLSHLDDEELLVYRVMSLGNIISQVHRQVAEYCFEQDLHRLFRQKGSLSASEIGNLFIHRMKEYTGDALVYDEFDANDWISWHHWRNFFYVYSYASGRLNAYAMISKLKNGTLTIEQVKKFFSKGSSQSPEQNFADMGIDITQKNFWEEGLMNFKVYLDETKALARKLGKF